MMMYSIEEPNERIVVAMLVLHTAMDVETIQMKEKIEAIDCHRAPTYLLLSSPKLWFQKSITRSMHERQSGTKESNLGMPLSFVKVVLGHLQPNTT
jgi:hypothetical protein